MKCTGCNRGDYEERSVTRTSDRDGAVVVVRGVPAWVCPECGDRMYDADVADRLLEQVKASRQEGVMMVVCDFVPVPAPAQDVELTEPAREAALAGRA